MTQYEILKHYFGYDSFREGQERLIGAILEGRDVLGIMPTGAGKSLCYQIPALMMDGITLVISPPYFPDEGSGEQLKSGGNSGRLPEQFPYSGTV